MTIMYEVKKRPKILHCENSVVFLTLFTLGVGGLLEPPLRQNRDNSYTERAMTFKFSDFP